MQSAFQISAYAHYARTPVLQLKQRTDDIMNGGATLQTQDANANKVAGKCRRTCGADRSCVGATRERLLPRRSKSADSVFACGKQMVRAG
jgi:hypothetical protein